MAGLLDGGLAVFDLLQRPPLGLLIELVHALLYSASLISEARRRFARLSVEYRRANGGGGAMVQIVHDFSSNIGLRFPQAFTGEG